MKARPDFCSSTGTQTSSVAPGYTVELEDRDIAGGEHAADDFARGDKRAQVRTLGLIDRRRNGDNVEIGLFQALRIGGVGDALGLCELLPGHLARPIQPTSQLGDTLPIDIEADHGEMTRKIDGERQTDITQTDDADAHIG